jgi:RNA polymerase sigma-70 factor (ECF subfamily)
LYGNQAEKVTENMVYFNELDDLIQAACRQLPPVRREVFMLSREEGLSHSEIAEKLNTSTSNVKNHIHKALMFLKDQMKMHEIVPIIFLLFI